MRSFRCWLMSLLALTCLLGVSAMGSEDRVVLPPAADVEKATKLIHDLFKNEFAKTSPKAKLALAETLFKQAEETTDDLAGQFVLLRETAELAAGGDVELALRAVDRLRNRFTAIPPEQYEALFKLLTTRTIAAADNVALANYLLRVADEAVVADELQTAERIASMAFTAAQKSKQLRTANLVSAHVKEIDEFKKEAPRVKAALKTLETDPANAAASTIAGKHYCFQRGQWEKGLPLLGAGDDPKIKAVAGKDVADPKDPSAQLMVADGWYEVGTAATGAARRAMLGRAFAFYTRAAPGLTGLNRTRAEKRIEELEKAMEVRGGQHEDFLSAIRMAVRAKNVEEIAPIGGFIGQKEYRETAPGGGVLIGFNYGTRKFNNAHDVISYLQPIYLTPSGEKHGVAYGKAPAKPLVVKAKPGYAVGALHVRGGGLLESYSVTFMRIQGKGLNSADNYSSPTMGREGRFGGRPIGDGRPIVGIFGKQTGEDEISTIGLILAGKPAK